jgi:hypothetical protein
MALPDQFEISAVRRLDDDPWAKNIFIASGSFMLFVHFYPSPSISFQIPSSLYQESLAVNIPLFVGILEFMNEAWSENEVRRIVDVTLTELMLQTITSLRFMKG